MDVREHGRALVDELKRRRVFRTAALYLAAAFIVLQVADLVLQAEFFPSWAYSAAVLVVVLGLPVAVVLAWAFDWTPEGVRRTKGTEGGPRSAGLARWAFVALVVVATGAAGLVAWDALDRAPAASETGVRAASVAAGAATSLDPRRIAVLYLDNRTRIDSLDYLARGLSEGLMTALARVDSLRVASRNAVGSVDRGARSVDDLLTELKVGTYVSGTLSRSAEGLRVDVELVDAGSSFTLSTHTLERPVTEALALRDTLVAELSEALRSRLGVEVRARDLREAGVTEESWRWVQRAARIREAVHSQWASNPGAAADALDRADSLLAAAESRSPDWVEPILTRGWVEYDRARWDASIPGETDRSALLRGLGHVERALVLRPGDRPRSLELRGGLRSALAAHLNEDGGADRMLALAARDLAAAVEERPGLARAWWLWSEVLRQQGRFDASLDAAERALAEDAYLEEASSVYRQLFHTAFEREQHDRAAHWCAEGRRRFPNRADTYLCRTLMLATVDTIAPDPGAIRALADSIVGMVPAGDSAAWRAYTRMQTAKVLARAGDIDAAEAAIRAAHGDTFQSWLGYDEAHARILLGQTDSALVLLEGFLALNPGRASYWPSDWWLRPLWTNPRFMDLVDTDPG